MKYVTSQEIMDATGIINVATLVRWHGQEELIPHPEIRTHPNGRGKIAYWPEWVLHRCVRIKQLRKEGMSLAQIREFLGSDWNAARRNHARRYRFSEASRIIDKDAALANVREVVAHFLIAWIKTQQTRILRTTIPTIAAGVIEKAIEMLEQGINPVLVLTTEATYLTADFAVSLYLSKCKSVDDSFMVVPVWREFSAYLDKVAPLPPQPTIYPVARVLRDADSFREEAEVVVMASWEFEIAPAEGGAARRKKP